MAAKAKQNVESGPVVLEQIGLETIKVPIIGTSELIVHNWSEKAKRMIKEPKKPGAKKAKEARDPEGDYEASKYKTPEGKDAFPTTGVKQALVDALRYFENITMVLGKTAFFVEGEFIEIDGTPRMREDMVRVGKGAADIRWRAGYPEWRSVLVISYATSLLTRESMLAIVNAAGQTQGIGDWRPSSPQKTGPFGRFKIDESRPVEVGVSI